MEKKYTKSGKVGGFFKKNIYYFLIIASLAIVAVVVTLSLTLGKSPITPPDDKTPVDVIPVEMLAPVSVDYTIAKEFADGELLWSETLRLFETHQGIDIQAPAGSAVVAVLDGEVISVSNIPLEGYVVVIKHSDTLRTVYKSLDEDVPVSIGQKVSRGDRIGSVADTMTYEIAEGPHLHFEVIESGIQKDPSNYIAALK